MPITLVTGLPGHGKTLYTLARWKDEAEKNGRPVFHNGIKNLKIPGWQDWKTEEWEKLPPNSIMVVDECQFVFPVRGRGQPPEFIEKLATHRHLGVDFIIITQNPMLLDSFVRRLVDRHFHVVRKFGTHFATVHEFVNGCNDNVHKTRKDSIRHEWRYPKHVFDLYTSAEAHTVKTRIPAKVYVLCAIPFVFAALAYAAYSRLNPDAMVERAGGKPATEQAAPGQPVQHSPTQNPGPEELTPAQYYAQYTPRIEGLPHTAPAYDEVTKPTEAPYPAACVASAKSCKCYTQQATKLQVTESLCRDIASGGFFMAWKQPAPTVQQRLDRGDAVRVDTKGREAERMALAF